MLKEDTKQFYRILGTKNIEVRESIYMAKLEPYWNSMLGEEAGLNDRNQCIKFMSSGKWVEMDFELIQIMNIASFLSKATIGNFLE